LEPSSWGFSVEETIHDHEQTVDITDDGTGEPHEIARQNIPMYVNEAGHGSELHENVVARHDVRTVFYYLYVKAPMHVGDTVELLVDYGDTYEGKFTKVAALLQHVAYMLFIPELFPLSFAIIDLSLCIYFVFE
jgi:hypothetical protein